MRTLSVVSLLHFLLLKANAQTFPLTENEIIYPYVPPICEPHVPLLFSYSDKRCGCFWQPEDALQDGSQATPCTTGPVGLEPNGRASCRDLSPTSSECFIQCDDKYKLDGNKCIFDDGNGVKDCGCDAPLSFAYPDKACACVTSLDKGSPGTQCVDPPSGHGKGLCRTLTKSECFTNQRYSCATGSGQILYSSSLPHCTCHGSRTDSPGFVECRDPVGGHGRAACLYGIQTECTFLCDEGYRVEGDKCVQGVQDPGPGAAKICQPHVPLMYSFNDRACGCFENPEVASPGTRCLGASGQEYLGACRNATASECFIKCDDGYKLEENDCVLNRTDTTLYYEDCPHHLPGRYLTADPVLGCVCQREPSDQWCQHPSGGGKASCFNNDDLSVVECRPECPEGKVAVNNECIPEYVDKFTSECKEGEVLNATDEGCLCQPFSTTTATGSTCWPPTTDGTGKGKCTMRYDGTKAACSIECNAPLHPNDCKDDCSAVGTAA